MATRDGETFEVLPNVDTETGEIYYSTDEYRLTCYTEALDALENAQDVVGRMEQSLMELAKEREATTIYGKGMQFVVTEGIDYQRDQLFPMLELFDPENLSHRKMREECYREAGLYQVWQETKWDMTKVKKHAKALGKEALEILEKATVSGKRRGKLVKSDPE